jgi:hypothetical protein
VRTPLALLGIPATLVAGLAAAAALGATAAEPAIPSIYVNYNSPSCTFSVNVDGGITVASTTAPGPTLPPGTYQLQVTMLNLPTAYTCGKPVFSLVGPGVSSTVEFRGEELHDERLVTLQASSTYVAEDASAPAATRRVFSTAASGSSGVLLTPGATQAPGGGGFVQGDIVGSAVLRYRGKLAATVTAAGRATLTRAGRRVASLPAGRYDIAVDDAAARAGFFVRRGARKPVTVTSVPFVGRRTQRVALAAGTWSFFSRVGKPTTFTVVR